MTAKAHRGSAGSAISRCLLGPDCPSCEGDSTSTCDYLDGTWYVTPSAD